MRIITISRIATVMLTLLALSLAVILYWGLDKLNQSFVSTLNYSELHRQVAVDVRTKIQTYLTTGDATFNSQALADLDYLNQQVLPGLPASLAKQLKPVADALYSGLSNEFLGAGKLAGDEQALLYQNERETAAALKRLENYALKAIEQQPQTAMAYLQATLRLTRLLSEIKSLREKFWSNGNDVYVQQIDKAREQYNQELQKVERLPRLGLYPVEQENEYASLAGWAVRAKNANAEEQGDEILRQLSSLHQRYPLEMQRSIQGLQARADSSNQVNQLINNLEQEIIQGQQYVNQSKDKIELLVKNLFFAFVAGLLLMAVMLYEFQKRFVINNLAKLQSALAALVEQGHLSMVGMNADRTELGQIAALFNQLIANMQRQQQEKNQQLQDIGVTLEQLLSSFDSIITNADTTREQLQQARVISQELNQLAQQVNDSSAKVRRFAEETASLMSNSENSAGEVVIAGEQAINKIDLSQLALLDLVKAVQHVMGILDQINHISDQTNLLAINATIESAHAGEHGRAFAVVADEVRQLSKKTHQAVSQSTELLSALNSVTDRVKQHIEAVSHSTEYQCDLAKSLQGISRQVGEHSLQASQTAQQSSSLTEQQYQSVASFSRQMQAMEQSANAGSQEVKQLRAHVSEKIQFLRTSLGV
ncbi:methyl-accepting chemotaxis protein [Thiopseudomonas acetoxidans]|uniref:Methyl-accepting chemotaxis protein n=1 Tax=Thiopseudomonas acetoxidans TaxID=3041622 RepID=A0ABT7SQ67_9GAMM|nr:methyl-accepting chemotaxis protein [Thiopseudomonas sp. CY1220]MDM7858321.1 methyl-accepting chemotaxis protein [Thiopseudomonas sp. CY1220]